MQKRAGNFQLWEMSGTELGGLFRRMERIKKQQQMVRDRFIFSGQHSRLTAPIGMACKNQAIGRVLAQKFRRLNKAKAVFFRFAGMRRTGAAALPKGEVTAQYMEAVRRELLSQRDEQGSIVIGACAVCEDNSSVVGFGGGLVQNALDSTLFNRFGHSITIYSQALEFLIANRPEYVCLPDLRLRIRECGTAGSRV